jgi:RimJ/RimL family protein N-acetyltransferase
MVIEVAGRTEIHTNRLVLVGSDDGRGGHWYILNAGEVIGSITRHRGRPEVEFGITLYSEGQGYATEAWYHLLRYYFEEKHVPKIASFVSTSNIPSLRLHKKLGFHLTGFDYTTVNKYNLPGGAFFSLDPPSFSQVVRDVETHSLTDYFKNASPEAGNPYFKIVPKRMVWKEPDSSRRA